MTDYRDPNNIDPNGNFSITQLVKFIREKMYGIDVRESIAKALERVYEDASKTGNANMEVSQARGDFNVLNDRLNNTDARLNTNDSRVSQKADKTYVDAVLSSLTTGGPKGLFYSLNALQTMYPNGTDGTYLVFDAIHEDAAHTYIWDGSMWKDTGPYQGLENADNSISRVKLSFPTFDTMQIVYGELNIDTVAKTVTASSDIVLSYGYNFVRPIEEEQTVSLPDAVSPVWIGFRDGNLIVTRTSSELSTNDSYLVAVWYGDLYAFDYKKIKINNLVYDNPVVYGGVISGGIVIDVSTRTININQGTIVTTETYFSPSVTTSISLGWESNSYLYFLVYHPSTNQFNVKSRLVGYDEVVIGFGYSGIFYSYVKNSKINIYGAVQPENEKLSWINWQNKDIVVVNTSNVKTITIPNGNTPISNNSGRYYLIPNELTVDFSDFTNRANTVMALYAKTSNFTLTELYVDNYKRNVSDVYIFSIYSNRVYGVDEATKKIITVNGIKNGGWKTTNNETDEKQFKYNSVSEWFSYVASGATSKIMWLSDSTWQGYTGPVNGGTTPFPTLVQSILDEYFGIGKVISVNKSIGGESIIGMVNRLEGYLQENPDTDVLMIGCGLNGINAASTSNRRQAFEQAIELCIEYDVMPVICTAQAHQVPNTESGDDWGGRTQFATEKYDRALRLGIAQKYNLDVLDYTDFTQKLLDNAPESISQLVEDGLHGSAIMHAYEADWTFSQLIPTVKKMSDTGIVTVYDQKVLASRSLRYVEDIARDEDGFKSQWDFIANDGDVLMDVWLYLEPNSFGSWSITAKGTGAFKMTVDGLDVASTLDEQKAGLYHVKVLATGGQVNFKGIKLSRD